MLLPPIIAGVPWSTSRENVMDGYFTTYVECAVEATVPQTVSEAFQSDEREIVVACAGTDGAK